MNKVERMTLYASLKIQLSKYSNTGIEDGVMKYFLAAYGFPAPEFDNFTSTEVAKVLTINNMPIELETGIEFFEFLLDTNIKNENGVVFTPKYIADYIVSSLFSTQKEFTRDISIIDPGCGGGIFLVSAAEYIYKKTGNSIDQIISNNLFGIDIDADNARRCNLILILLSAKYGGNYRDVKTNVFCVDSLKCDWTELCNRDSFDFIIGNPPYVNPHDMNIETTKYLKNTFSTTKSGVFNIFYAFIELGMRFLSSNGFLGFIVPNNFISIKSAIDLREYLQTNRYLFRILDFGDNMVFRPVRTYNCILLLSKACCEEFDYSMMEKTEDIEETLNSQSFLVSPINRLDKNGWKLVDEQTHNNLRKIEAQLYGIKNYIRTGIATLRDNVFFVESDDSGYYKRFDGRKHYIENDLVKPIYKIPDLRLSECIDNTKRHIIFPYTKSVNGYCLIPEALLKEKHPRTYAALSFFRDELNLRDKGKGNPQGWYAYGRTQGLNKYGKKLLFPTFSKYPRFIYIDDENALFCNGYAVFENDCFNLDVLARILNSKIMSYYIRNTSYTIEGGYYCYQKKYIERFSIPWLSEDAIAFIKQASNEELDAYLWNLYRLD